MFKVIKFFKKYNRKERERIVTIWKDHLKTVISKVDSSKLKTQIALTNIQRTYYNFTKFFDSEGKIETKKMEIKLPETYEVLGERLKNDSDVDKGIRWSKNAQWVKENYIDTIKKQEQQKRMREDQIRYEEKHRTVPYGVATLFGLFAVVGIADSLLKS